MMQAVILAGGLGTRLWPITKDVPKPMVPVRGVPYLEHQLRYLARQGVRSIVLLTGYLGEQVEAYFGDGSGLGMSIRYSREPQPLGTGGALKLAAELLAPSFLLIYGDSFLPMDYGAAMTRLELPGAVGLVVVYDNRLADTSVRNNIAIDGGGLVTRYEKDAADKKGLDFVEAGVLAFRREVTSLIGNGAVSLEKEIFPELIRLRQLVAYVTSQRFYDIGTPERLAAFERYLTDDHHANSVPD